MHTHKIAKNQTRGSWIVPLLGVIEKGTSQQTCEKHDRSSKKKNILGKSSY